MSLFPGVFSAPIHPGVANTSFPCQIQNDKITTSIEGIDFVGEPLANNNRYVAFIKKKDEDTVWTVPVPKIFIFQRPQLEIENNRRPTTVTKREVTEKFGLAKQKRALAKLDKNASNPSLSIEADRIHNKLQSFDKSRTSLDATGLSVSLIDNSLLNEDDESLLPPIDKITTDPAKIYDIDWLTPQNILNLLISEANLLQSADFLQIQTWRTSETYPKTILSRLETLPKDGSKLKLISQLALLRHMFLLHALKYRQLVRKLPLPDSPCLVANFLLDRYTTMVETAKGGNQRNFSTNARTRLLLHMLILLLAVNGYQVVLNEIAEDFHLPHEKLLKFFAQLGCKYESVNEGSIKKVTVTLEAPYQVKVIGKKKK